MTSLERFQQEISDEAIERWEQVFVQVNVRHQVLKMETWIVDNPGKAAARKHWRRFASNWLAKTQRDMEAIDQREITRHEIDRLRSQGYHVEGNLTRQARGTR